MTTEEKINEARETKKLDLSQMGLASIPDEVFAIENLEELVLGGYLKRFPFPHLDDQQWGNYNFIQEVPEDIARLAKLKSLDLTFNPLVDFPKALLDLRNLEHLQLNLCGITEIPKEISILHNLSSLGLISFKDWQSFAFSMGYSYDDFYDDYSYNFHLEELKSCWATGKYQNQIVEICNEICQLPKLKLLDLSNNRVSHLTDCQKEIASKLNLEGNPISL